MLMLGLQSHTLVLISVTVLQLLHVAVRFVGHHQELVPQVQS